MTRRARIAWVMAAVTWAAAATQVVVAVAADGIGLFSAATLYEGFPIVTLAAITGATVGALIVARQPGNRIGWLLCVGQLLTLVGLAVADYGRYAFDGRLPGSRETAQLAMYCGHLLGGALAISLVTLLLLLVPDGRLLSRRWRPAAAAVVIAPVVNAVAVLVTPVSAMTTASDRTSPPDGRPRDRGVRVPLRGRAGRRRGAATAHASRARGATPAAALDSLVGGNARRRRGRQRLRRTDGCRVGAALVSHGAAVPRLPQRAGRHRVRGAAIPALRRRHHPQPGSAAARAAGFVTAGYVAVVVVIGAFLGRQAGAAFWPRCSRRRSWRWGSSRCAGVSVAGPTAWRTASARAVRSARELSPASWSPACQPPSCSRASPRRRPARSARRRVS
jgi:hypothetical protein